MTATTEKPAAVLDVLRRTPAPVRYLLGGVLVNQLGAFVQTFMMLYLVFRGFSAGQAGVAITAYSLGSVVGGFAGGELVHRVGPRATITVAMLGSAAVLAVVPLFGRPALFGLVIAALLLAGLANQSYRPAAAVLLSDLMPHDARVMGFSMMRIALNLGAALSPLIAAGLILLDWNLLLWFDAATALCYAVLARLLLPDVRVGSRAPGMAGPARTSTRAAYGILLRDARFWLFLASVLIGTVIYVQYTIALPLKISSEGHSTGLYSAVLVTASALLVLFELKITTYVVRWPGYVAATVGTVLMGLGVAGFGVSGGSAVALVAFTVVFVFGIMINGPTMFAYPATFPAPVKARYVSAHQATFGLGMAVGPLFGVAAWMGLGNRIWWLCGGLGLVSALCALIGMAPRREPRPVAEARTTWTFRHGTVNQREWGNGHMSNIRQVSGYERLHTAFTLYPYAFDETPSASSPEQLRASLPFHEGNHTLVVEEGGQTIATAAAIPAHQNLRGSVLRMAGVAWVATHPGARRQGHSHRLMCQLHSDMLDKGHFLAALYPFHPSSYEKLGYVGFPQNRTAAFAPQGLAPLRDVKLPGEVSWQGIRDGFEVYRAFQRRMLSQRHGFMFTPDYRAVRVLDPADRWLATATVDGDVIGLVTYRIDGYGGCLRADELLYTDELGRALLLQFLAHHAYQVSQIMITVAPDEFPETWATGLAVRTEAETTFPTAPSLMGRLLSMEALRGVPCGSGLVEIEVVDDDLLAGQYLLDGTGGTIDVATPCGAGERATLTAAGLSGLAYGVLGPVDVVARGLGEIPEAAAVELRALLPRCTPHAFGKG